MLAAVIGLFLYVSGFDSTIDHRAAPDVATGSA